jgi:glycosyltransferase involved in cell wall biosynthesis
LWIHSSFFYTYPILIRLFLYLRNLRRISVVADVRDVAFGSHAAQLFSRCDHIIFCGQYTYNAYQRLVCQSRCSTTILELPVSISLDDLSQDVPLSNISDINRLSSPYLFFAGGLVSRKGIEAACNLVGSLRSSIPDIKLVVVGNARKISPLVRDELRNGRLIYLGPLPHSSTIELSRRSLLDINLSICDSTPRHAYEALYCGARVTLPLSCSVDVSNWSEFFIDPRLNPCEMADRAISIINLYRSNAKPDVRFDKHLFPVTSNFYRGILLCV